MGFGMCSSMAHRRPIAPSSARRLADASCSGAQYFHWRQPTFHYGNAWHGDDCGASLQYVAPRGRSFCCCSSFGRTGPWCSAYLAVLQQGYNAIATILGAEASLRDGLDLLAQPMPKHPGKNIVQPLPFERSIRLDEVGFRYATMEAGSCVISA